VPIFSSRSNGTLRALALWVGLVALIVQSLVPICVSGTASASGGASIVICTVQGMQTVQIDADGKPVPSAPSSGHETCFLCLGCHLGGGFIAPQFAVLAAPSSPAHEAIAFAEAPARARPPYRPYSNRGPPASNETIEG
jgi:hypothetical protein